MGDRCIPGAWFCDGIGDCQDGSDEPAYLKCDAVDCAANELACSDGLSCIPEPYVCDGILDCFDDSDETSCVPPCAADEWQCDDGECIPDQWWCDDYRDCNDESDEAC